jgi:hypothetical protein
MPQRSIRNRALRGPVDCGTAPLFTSPTAGQRGEGFPALRSSLFAFQRLRFYAAAIFFGGKRP